jgi:hypothetical protein
MKSTRGGLDLGYMDYSHPRSLPGWCHSLKALLKGSLLVEHTCFSNAGLTGVREDPEARVWRELVERLPPRRSP